MRSQQRASRRGERGRLRREIVPVSVPQRARRPGRGRARRAPASRHDPRGARAPAPGLRPGGHRDRRQLVGDQRRRRRDGRDERGGRPRAGRAGAGDDPRLRVGRRRPLGDGPRPGRGRPRGPREGRRRAGRHRPDRAQRGVRGPVARPCAGAWAWIRTAPTSTAGRSRSAIRSAPPGARVLTTLLHEMGAGSARLGLAALCIGGGQGIAMVVERTRRDRARRPAAAGDRRRPPVAFGAITVRLGAGTRRHRGAARRADHRAAPGPARARGGCRCPAGGRGRGCGCGRSAPAARAGRRPCACACCRARPGGPGGCRASWTRPCSGDVDRLVGADAGDRGRLRAAPGQRVRGELQRRRPVPGGEHAEGGDPGGRGAPGPRGAAGAAARPDDPRLGRRGGQRGAGGPRRGLGRGRRRERDRQPPPPGPGPLAGAPALHRRGRPPAAADHDRFARPPCSPTSSPRPSSSPG